MRSKVWIFICVWSWVCVLQGVLCIDYGDEEEETEDSDVDYEYKREHCLAQPYWGHGWMIPNWDFLGTTVVTNDYVRLTADSKSQQGGIWNNVPVELANWEIVSEFKIHGRGTELAGDGLVYWYVKEKMQHGPVFGSKNNFYGLAIAIDTYNNEELQHHQYPYISIMINNGSLHFEHGGDGTLKETAGCEVKVRNLEQNTRIRIRYLNDELTVWTDAMGEEFWRKCAKIENVTLPTHYYFGVTAETGDLSDNHDILSIYTHEIQNSKTQPVDIKARSLVTPSVLPRDPSLGPEEVTHTESGRSWFKSIMIYLGIIAVIGGLGVSGYLGYQHYNQQNRKRFY